MREISECPPKQDTARLSPSASPGVLRRSQFSLHLPWVSSFQNQEELSDVEATQSMARGSPRGITTCAPFQAEPLFGPASDPGVLFLRIPGPMTQLFGELRSGWLGEHRAYRQPLLPLQQQRTLRAALAETHSRDGNGPREIWASAQWVVRPSGQFALWVMLTMAAGTKEIWVKDGHCLTICVLGNETKQTWVDILHPSQVGDPGQASFSPEPVSPSVHTAIRITILPLGCKAERRSTQGTAAPMA